MSIYHFTADLVVVVGTSREYSFCCFTPNYKITNLTFYSFLYLSSNVQPTLIRSIRRRNKQNTAISVSTVRVTTLDLEADILIFIWVACLRKRS